MSSTNVSSDSESDSEVEELKSSNKASENTDYTANNESSSEEEEDSSEDDDEEDDERRTTGGIGPSSSIPKQDNGEDSEEDEEVEEGEGENEAIGLGTDVFALIEEYSKRKRFDVNEGEEEIEQEQNEDDNIITKKVKTSSALLYLDPTEQNPFLINKANRNWKKPNIENVTPSEALARVKAFLPQFAAANTILQQKIDAGEGDQHQINVEAVQDEVEDENEDGNADVNENGEVQENDAEGNLNLIESIGNFDEDQPVNMNDVEQYIEMNLGLFEDTDFNESNENGVEQEGIEQQELDNNSNVTLIRLA